MLSASHQEYMARLDQEAKQARQVREDVERITERAKKWDSTVETFVQRHAS